MIHDFISEDKNHVNNQFQSALEETLREGARKLLQQAIEMEVAEYIEMNRQRTDESGKRVIVRNGHLPERNVQTGLGQIPVKCPRIRDKSRSEKFTSKILPPYMRRTPSVEALIPALYLKGISSGDFTEALEAILGENAKGLSPTNITRLKSIWQQEYKEWESRSLCKKQYVYIWVDGIYFNVRLDDKRLCFLVIIGALPDGRKELVAIHVGYRESKLSWLEVLNDLKKRGLEDAPKLAIGDGALGFWAALEEAFPETKQQRCWVHKTANILDKMPKCIQSSAKRHIHDIYMAPTKQQGLRAYEEFIDKYDDRYPKACECLRKDKDQLFSFYDFPAIHWQHIRTTNPIESTFATIRHRTRQTKGCGSEIATVTMVFKLATSAEKKWRRLRGYREIEKVINGVKFKDGEEVKEAQKVA